MASRYATLAEIRALSPQLESDTTDPEVLLARWMGIAEALVGVDAWADLASRGHALLVAHLAAGAVGGAFGPAGPVTSEAVGAVSRSFGSSSAPADQDADLRTTFYG